MLHPERIRRIVLAALAVLLGGAAGCGPPAPSSRPLQVPPPPAIQMALGPEDVITVRVYGEPDLSGDFQVATDGTIVFSFLGRVPVAGKTPAQVAAALEDGLAKGYLKYPEVTVLIKDFNSRRVVVYGEVQKPGQFPYNNGMSIAQAISQAGGFTQMAAMDAVVVTRKETAREQQAFRVDVKAIAQGRASDYYLLPGDQVFVPQRIF